MDRQALHEAEKGICEVGSKHVSALLGRPPKGYISSSPPESHQTLPDCVIQVDAWRASASEGGDALIRQ